MGSNRDNSIDYASEGKVAVGFHVVCLLDVLGQRNKLQQWPKTPSPERHDELVQAMKDTAGTVRTFKKLFESHYSQMDAVSLSEGQLSMLTPEQRERFFRARECHLSTQQFSDTFVFYAPLTNSYGDVTVNPFYRVLTAAAVVLPCSLAGAAPIRGAITVGLGMEIEPENFYGPSLAEAHHLENEVAEYPRVVVSEEAVRFARGNCGFSSDPVIEKLYEELNAVCRSFIAKDSDGQYIVDFLCNGLRETQGSDAEVGRGVSKAYQFVQNEERRFKRAGDEKHMKRYERLRAYMESRLPAWGIRVGECGNEG